MLRDGIVSRWIFSSGWIGEAGVGMVGTITYGTKHSRSGTVISPHLLPGIKDSEFPMLQSHALASQLGVQVCVTTGAVVTICER